MILRILTFKVCICLWLIHALKYGNSAMNEHDAVLMNLLSFAGSYMFCSCLGRMINTRTTFLQNCLDFTTILVVVTHGLLAHYVVQSYIDKNYYILDLVYPCINITSCYQCLLNEVSPLLSFFVAVYRHYQWKKTFSFVIYLGSNVLCLLFFIDVVFTYLHINVYQNIEQNIFMLSRDHIEHYPVGYMSPHVEDTTRYEKPSAIVWTFTSGMNTPDDKCIAISGPSYGHDLKLPLNYEIVHRYVGEDVYLECNYEHNVVIQPDNPIWKIDGKKALFNNSRRHVVHRTTFSVENNNFKINSVLRIRHLTPSDFGEYTCLAHSSSPVPQTDYIQRSEITIAVYELKRIKQKTVVIHKLAGHVLFFSKQFHMHCNDDSAEGIHVIYTINSQPVDDVCSRSERCLIPSSLNMQSKKLPRVSTVIDLDIGFWVRISVQVQFCLCSDAFGVHRVTFLRELHLSNKRYRIVEVEHPYVFVILPESAPSLFRFFQDDRHLYAKIEHMVEHKENPDDIERQFIQISPYIVSNEFKVYSIAIVIQVISLCLTYYMMICLTQLIVRYYCRLFIFLPLNICFEDDMLEDSYHRLALEDDSFDVFVSHAEEERGIVNEILLPFLESDCQRRTCSSERDITPGVPFLPTYYNYITKSKRIVIILSQGYLEDRHCFNLQFEHIILPLLCGTEGRVNSVHHVLVILYGREIGLPGILQQHERVQSVRWTNEAPTDKDLKLIKKWLFGSKYRVCSIL